MQKNKGNDTDNVKTFDINEPYVDSRYGRASFFEVPSLLYKSFFIAAVSCVVWFAYLGEYLMIFVVTLGIAIIGCLSSWFFTKRNSNGELYLIKVVVLISLIVKTLYVPFFVWFNLTVISRIVLAEDERIKFAAAVCALVFILLCIIAIIKTIKILTGTKGLIKTPITSFDFTW